jgi:hypothetical protein
MPALRMSFVHHDISCLGRHLFNLEFDLPLVPYSAFGFIVLCKIFVSEYDSSTMGLKIPCSMFCIVFPSNKLKSTG